MECRFCPGTEWFELIASCGFKFGKTSKAFREAESSLENARKYAEYRLTPEEIYFYKDDKIAIFRDVHPNTKFHVLVVPIMHIEQPDGLVLYPEILNHMFKVSLDLVNSFEQMRESQLYFNHRNISRMQDFTKHVHLQVTSTTRIPFADIKEFFRGYLP
jgi:diadenosine tetraphosphate (Ap4A) HIT family hydrolase